MPADNNGRDNNLEERLSRVESDLASVKVREQDDRERIHQLEKQTEAINNLATSVAVMASKQDAMNSDLSEVKASIKAVEDVPKKRYDKLIGYIVAAVVSGVIGYLISIAFGG